MPQRTLFVPPRAEIPLTDRLAFALSQLPPDGLTSFELGVLMHERRGKHPASTPCDWCHAEGESVGAALRKKGLVVKRQQRRWTRKTSSR